MPGSREAEFSRNTSILHFLPQNYLPCSRGSWNFQFLVSLPYRCHVPNLVKIDLVVIEKKMITNDWRRTPTHSNGSPEWLRWPKNINCAELMRIRFTRDSDWRHLSIWLYGTWNHKYSLDLDCLITLYHRCQAILIVAMFYHGDLADSSNLYQEFLSQSESNIVFLYISGKV